MAGVAVVTGANRGIGLELVRQLAQRGFTTVLGSRDPDKGRAAAEGLAADGIQVEPRRLDVDNDDSVRKLAAELEAEHGRSTCS